MKRKIITGLLATTLSISLLSGCSPSVSYDEDLVGSGEVVSSLEGFTKLEDKDKEKVLKAISEKFKDVKTETMDFSIAMDMEMGVSEESSGIGMSMNMDATADCLLDGDIQYQNIEANVNVLGMEIPLSIEQYIESDDENTNLYQKLSALGQDSGWTKSVKENTEEETADKDDNNMSSDSITDIYKNEEGTYVFIHDFSEMEIDPEILGVTNEIINETGSITDVSSVDLSEATIYSTFDDGLGFVGIYADLSDSFGKVADMSIDNLIITVKMNSINDENIKIEIPEEAKNASESTTTDDPLSFEFNTNDNLSSDTNNFSSSVTDVLPSITDVSISLNENILSLPCTISDLENCGLIFSEELTLEANDFDVAIAHTASGESTFYISLENNTDQALSFRDCDVTGIDYSIYASDEEIPFVISGVSFGMNEGEVSNLFGEPTSTYSSDGFTMNSYEFGDYTVTVSLTDDSVDGLSIDKY